MKKGWQHGRQCFRYPMGWTRSFPSFFHECAVIDHSKVRKKKKELAARCKAAFPLFAFAANPNFLWRPPSIMLKGSEIASLLHYYCNSCFREELFHGLSVLSRWDRIRHKSSFWILFTTASAIGWILRSFEEEWYKIWHMPNHTSKRLWKKRQRIDRPWWQPLIW